MTGDAKSRAQLSCHTQCYLNASSELGDGASGSAWHAALAYIKFS